MSLHVYHQYDMAKDRYTEFLREAQNERRAREAAGGTDWRLSFSWLKRAIVALQHLLGTWVARKQSLASQKYSYLENPDPFRNCTTC